MNSVKKYDLLLHVCCIVFFISIICCFRAVSSICVGLLLLVGLLQNREATGSWFNQQLKNPFVACCCLFYLLQIIAAVLGTSFEQSGKHVQTQSGIVLIPLAVCYSNYFTAPRRAWLMSCCVCIITTAMIYCLLLALWKYFYGHAETGVFFYYALVEPFHQHAVQVSIFLFIGLVWLLEQAHRGNYNFHKAVHFLLILFFTGCLLLLSSKLVIVFSACCLLFYFILLLRSKRRGRFVATTCFFIALVAMAVLLFTKNKISERFSEIFSGRINIVEQQNFDPNIYFNGLQFRLLQWRFVKEVLTEQHAWLEGVSANAQSLLDRKYIATHMYTGNGHEGGGGYLGYNTHNQFLESLLQAGIPGLLVFSAVCMALLVLAVRKKDRVLSMVVLLLIAYCFNESVLETQYGIVLFTFFPLFLYTEGAGRKMLQYKPVKENQHL